MDSKKKKGTAQTACLSGMAILLMIKPLSNGTHPAVLLAIGVVGAVMIVFGMVTFSRLVSEKEKEIDELRAEIGGE